MKEDTHMPNHKPPHRPTSCNEKRIKIICNALEACASKKDAARMAGIGETTFKAWGKRARGAFEEAGLDSEDPPEDWRDHIPEKEHIFCDFLLRAEYAHASAHLSLLNSLKLSATGGKILDEEGNVLSVVEADWRAAAKLLAIRSADYAERKRHEHSGPAGKPIAVKTYTAINLPEQVEDAVERAKQQARQELEDELESQYDEERDGPMADA